MKWSALKIYGFPICCQLLHPCVHSTIHSSPQHPPSCCLLQLESLLATPALPNSPLDPASFVLPVKLHGNSSTVCTAQLWCAMSRAALPPLVHPTFPQFRYMRIHVSLWLLDSRSWKEEHAVKQSLSF